MDNIQGKTIAITGAARGIGLATTKLFIEQGRRVAMVDRDGDELMKAARGLNSVVPLVYDVSDPDQVDRMTEEATGALGRVVPAVACEGDNTGSTTPGAAAAARDRRSTTAPRGLLHVNAAAASAAATGALSPAVW